VAWLCHGQSRERLLVCGCEACDRWLECLVCRSCTRPRLCLTIGCLMARSLTHLLPCPRFLFACPLACSRLASLARPLRVCLCVGVHIMCMCGFGTYTDTCVCACAWAVVFFFLICKNSCLCTFARACVFCGLFLLHLSLLVSRQWLFDGLLALSPLSLSAIPLCVSARLLAPCITCSPLASVFVRVCARILYVCVSVCTCWCLCVFLCVSAR